VLPRQPARDTRDATPILAAGRQDARVERRQERLRVRSCGIATGQSEVGALMD